MKKIVSLLIIISLFTSFTGCTSDFKVNEVVVKDISDKITQAVIETVDSNIKAEKKETHTIDGVNSTELIVKGEVGDINITTHDSNVVLIDTNIKAKSNTKERAEELIKNFSYTVEGKGKTVIIDTTRYEGKLGTDQLSVDISVKIPSTIDTINITSNVGDININDINGEINALSNVGDIVIKNTNALYDIKTDVGDIQLENSVFSGKSEFYLNVGSIDISATDITDAKSLSIETKVGDIKISLPINSDYKADINEFMKEPRTELSGNGKTNIKLITDVGSIEFK